MVEADRCAADEVVPEELLEEEVASHRAEVVVEVEDSREAVVADLRLGEGEALEVDSHADAARWVPGWRLVCVYLGVTGLAQLL